MEDYDNGDGGGGVGGPFVTFHLQELIRHFYYPTTVTTYPGSFGFVFWPLLVGSLGILFLCFFTSPRVVPFIPDGPIQHLRFIYFWYGLYYLWLHLNHWAGTLTEDKVNRPEWFIFGPDRGITPLISMGPLLRATFDRRTVLATLGTTGTVVGAGYHQHQTTKRCKMEAERWLEGEKLKYETLERMAQLKVNAKKEVALKKIELAEKTALLNHSETKPPWFGFVNSKPFSPSLLPPGGLELLVGGSVRLSSSLVLDFVVSFFSCSS